MCNEIFRGRTFNRFCYIFPIWYIWATGAFVPASLYKVDWLVYQFNIEKNHFRLLCIISSLLLCILSASRLPILVCTACYTNLYVPFSRLNAEILAPLEQEIRGLQQFRQPTSEELEKAGSTCPVCLDVMHVSRITPCGHIFHSHCLRQCLSRSVHCPCCRTKIV